jgi:glycosyltransferase involved in cell wall biosynthesis
MRVLHLLASPGPTIGGMERQVALLAGSMATGSTKAAVIADPSYANLFTQAGAQFLPLNLKRSRYNPFLLWDLANTVRQFQPNIIHAHGHKAAALCARLKRKLAETRFVATVHGTKRHNAALQNMDAIIAVSQGVADALQPLPATVIHNALPNLTEPAQTRENLCRQWQLDPTKPIIAAVGRLVALKRYDLLIEAVNKLNAQLILFGDGPKRAELEYLKGPNVRLAGHIDNVRAWLPAVDLFVICSEREGLSLAMLEALHAGVPVLSTPVSGAIELLPDTALIRNASVKGIAHAITTALDHPDTLRVSLNPVFERVQNELTPERLVAQTLTIYRKVYGGVEKGSVTLPTD